MQRLYLVVRVTAFVALLSLCLTGQSKKHEYSRREKAFFADPALVDFVRPGLGITISSASLASSGAISVTYTLSDPAGLPLDAAGVNTPGVISMTYIASAIPQGQEQYVAYTTAQATGKALGTITRPNFELGGGQLTPLAPGQYQYTFKAQAPAGFDGSATTTIALVGSRDLTSFNLGINYAGKTFNFVPNGAAVTVTRDVIRTGSCNTCHDQLAFHGGHAIGLEMCVLCHQPQNADPVTGNALDAKVLFHKIHMGAQLPSVVGTSTTPGVPFQVAGFMNRISDFSTVVDPADPRRCEVCHTQSSAALKTTGGAQANAFLTKPSRAACGACHDDVNFVTGANHPGGFQTDDTQCANCHVPQGETPFDASIMGAHVVPTDTAATYPQNPDALLPGLDLAITSVTNTAAGQTPIVNFTVQDDKGNSVSLSKVSTLQFTMAGPTTDYGYTDFGSASTPGYVTESALKAACDSSGACSYTFTHAIPAASTGTYSLGGEARMNVTVLSGTTSQQMVVAAARNPLVNFSVDGSAIAARRSVVALSNCNQCHVALSLHGGLRNNTEYCVLCHNPSNTDFTQRPNAKVAADKAAPPQGINFNLLVHRIHDGVNVTASGGKPFVVVGFGGSHNDFSGVLFPAMSPTGQATYLQNCSLCHVNGSEQNLPIGLNPVTDPQGWINPVEAVASACSGCHVSKPEASHFLANTDSLGESCTICHASGAHNLQWMPYTRPSASRKTMTQWRAAVLGIFLSGAMAAPPWAAAQTPPPGFAGSDTCKICHEDIYNGFTKSPHGVVDTDAKRGFQGRGCESCHGPAQAHTEGPSAANVRNPAKLGAAAADQLCLTCHLNQPTHIGRLESSHARNQISCTACHKIHASQPLAPRKADAINTQCGSCHLNVWAQFQRPFHHKLPEGAMSCVDCHNPHGSTRPAMLQTFASNEPGCLACHGDERGPFTFEHAPLRFEGCQACHSR